MIFFEDETFSEEDALLLNNLERRRLRDWSNIFDLPSREFIQHFRVNKEAFTMILNFVGLKSLRNTRIPPTLQLAATLNLLSSGGYQINVGSNRLISMGQPTMSQVFENTIKILERILCPRWIKMKEERFNETRNYFFTKYKIPGIIGIVDGTHIPILRPCQDEHAFYNRKGFHSINVMIVSDHLYKILAIDRRYGGSSHDSTVWNNSTIQEYLQRKYEEENLCLRMLGDSGYPLLPWLLTPYRSAAAGSAEEYFNYIPAKARSQVERTIGMLKARFRCLSSDRKLRYRPEKVGRIINVCAAIHNICVNYKIQIEPLQVSVEEENSQPAEIEIIPESQQSRAKIIRDHIKNNL